MFPTQYCAMPVIQYPQLENELFCNVFYLRHLCDTQKFPDWPIKKPVSSLNHAYLQVWLVRFRSGEGSIHVHVSKPN